MAAYVASQFSTHFVPDLPGEGAARRWERSADNRGDAAAVSPRGKANFRCASAPQAWLNGIRSRPHPVIDGFTAIHCR